MLVEPLSDTTPRPVRRVVFTQTWSNLAFVHWAVDPARVAPLLPPGAEPDVLDGVTYVGLIPFVMRGLGFGRGPGLPYLGTFAETNVRLYSRDAAGRRGVVFASLDASRLAPVVAARSVPRLPYLWARMRVRREGDRFTYTCRRRWPGPRGATSRMVVRVGEPVRPGPVEQFVTARWGLHAAGPRLGGWGGGTYYWPNEHPAWPLRSAALEHLDDDLLAAAGFPDLAATPPSSVLFSDGVRTRFGAPRSCGAPAGRR